MIANFDVTWGVWLTWNSAGIFLLAQKDQQIPVVCIKLDDKPDPRCVKECHICGKIFTRNFFGEEECYHCGMRQEPE